jgi:hypothetical protein
MTESEIRRQVRIVHDENYRIARGERWRALRLRVFVACVAIGGLVACVNWITHP